MTSISQDIITRAIDMAEQEIDLKTAQKAHKLHEGKSLREICDVDIFDDESMCENLDNYVNTHIDETEADQDFEKVYATYQFIMGRYATWCGWAEEA